MGLSFVVMEVRGRAGSSVDGFKFRSLRFFRSNLVGDEWFVGFRAKRDGFEGSMFVNNGS